MCFFKKCIFFRFLSNGILEFRGNVPFSSNVVRHLPKEKCDPFLDFFQKKKFYKPKIKLICFFHKFSVLFLRVRLNLKIIFFFDELRFIGSIVPECSSTPRFSHFFKWTNVSPFNIDFFLAVLYLFFDVKFWFRTTVLGTFFLVFFFNRGNEKKIFLTFIHFAGLVFFAVLFFSKKSTLAFEV